MEVKKLVIVRYGELFLKGKNRNFFITKLITNIKKAFEQVKIEQVALKKISDGLLIYPANEKQLPLIKSALSKIFGISNFSFVYSFTTSLTNLDDFVASLDNYYSLNKQTFKFAIRRNWKGFSQDSFTLQQRLGAMVVNQYKLKVDLTNPQLILDVNIYAESIFVTAEKFAGAKGLPVGTSGKGLLLLSGGIDSPVAAWKLMKRGVEITYLHFYQQRTGQEKITTLVEKLAPYNNYSQTIYLVNTQSLLREISHISQSKYRLAILKRMFVRLANKLQAEKKEWQLIATGDSLGQVASQTVESLQTIETVSPMIIMRPLLTDDKEEIINISKQLGVYQTSLADYEDCCSLFEPKFPVTRPREDELIKLEQTIYWEEILNMLLQQKEFKVLG